MEEQTDFWWGPWSRRPLVPVGLGCKFFFCFANGRSVASSVHPWDGGKPSWRGRPIFGGGHGRGGRWIRLAWDASSDVRRVGAVRWRQLSMRGMVGNPHGGADRFLVGAMVAAAAGSGWPGMQIFFLFCKRPFGRVICPSVGWWETLMEEQTNFWWGPWSRRPLDPVGLGCKFGCASCRGRSVASAVHAWDGGKPSWRSRPIFGGGHGRGGRWFRLAWDANFFFVLQTAVRSRHLSIRGMVGNPHGGADQFLVGAMVAAAAGSGWPGMQVRMCVV